MHFPTISYIAIQCGLMKPVEKVTHWLPKVISLIVQNNKLDLKVQNQYIWEVKARENGDKLYM